MSYEFRTKYTIFNNSNDFIQSEIEWKSLDIRKEWKKYEEKNMFSNWSSLFDRGTKRSPIQVWLGSMLLQVTHKVTLKIELKK